MAKPGRPTKYRPEYCDRVVEYGRQGMGKAEIAYELDVHPDTLLNWCREHPTFFGAMTRATALSEGWWEAQGRKGIWSRDFNAMAYRLQMHNRFSWSDKQATELTGKNGGPIETADVRQRFTSRIAGLASRIGAGTADPVADGNGAAGS